MQETLEEILKFNYPQTKFKLSKDHFTCLKGTWGCGKSRAALMTANDECETYPNNLYLVMRKEWVDLRDSTLHDWNDWIGRKVNGEKNVVYENGSILMFRHGDDLDALKNINLGGCLMVQAEEMSEDDLWFINGRLRRKEGTRQLRLECNYDGHNWIYRLFNEKKSSDGTKFEGNLITTNTFDNEENLPPDYIPNLKRLPKKLRDRYLYGSDADMEGLVWDEFSPRHIIDPFYVPEGWKKIYALDHGFTNPTAVLFFAIDYDDVMYCYDEHYESGKPISYHASKIKERTGLENARKLADPSIFSKNQSKEGSIYSIADEYRDYGIVLNPAENNQLAGINRVNEYFKQDKLFIFKNCINTIREVSNWKWKKLRPMQLAVKNTPDEPMDKDDHTCLVGNSKILMGNKSQKKLQDVKIGEYVQTSNGVQRVVDSRLTKENAEIYKLKLSDGRELYGTGNHPVYTNNGKKRLDCMRYGDIIKTWNQYTLTEENIIGTDIITPRVVEKNASILMCGCSIMGQFLRTVLSTIKMVMQEIITLLTLNFKREEVVTVTPHGILNYVYKTRNIENGIKNCWNKYVHSLKSGMLLKKDACGIANIQKKYGQLKSLRREYVQTVGKHSKDLLGQNTATITVNQHIGENLKKIWNNVFVLSAKRLLQSINTLLKRPVHVLAVEGHNPKQNVYNLTVENSHTYYANGILVSNCDTLRYTCMSRTSKPDMTIVKTVNPESAWGRAEAIRNRKAQFVH